MVNSSRIYKDLAKRLSKRRLFYVCRDIERAMAGLDLRNYYIITNKTNFSAKLAKKHGTIILVKNKQLLDTAQLLERAETQKTIKPKDFVLVFKNNTIIETICRNNKWKLLNPSAQLADRVESKISQVAWLGNLALFLPPHSVSTCAQTIWQDKKFILQFNHAHTGSGTFLIDSKAKLTALQAKFPNRPVRIMDYIDGPVLTNNNIVWDNLVLPGNISYQITGLSPFTENKFTTIGNDWALPALLLGKDQIKQYKKIVTSIGKKLCKRGWKGLFGVDMIMDKQTGQLYLLEINARQPASTTFESQLQQNEYSGVNLPLSKREREGVAGASGSHSPYPLSGRGGENLTTTFEAHLAALLNVKPKNYNLITINNGAQIVKRVTSKISRIQKPKFNIPEILQVIQYNNTAPGSDLVRIQSSRGIMKTHNTFNELGNLITYTLGLPSALQDVHPGFIWDSKKIWKLNLPITEIDISKLIWHFDLQFWEKEGTDDWNLTPWEVIKNPTQEPSHYKKINAADTSYPIVIYKLKNQWRILDGLHRLAKLYIEHVKKIKVQIVTPELASQIKK